MKKTNKLAALLLTSLTLMTGCNGKGKEITKDEAQDVLAGIVEESKEIYKEGKLSFTADAEIVSKIDGNESVMKTELEYDADNEALYVKSYIKDANTTVELEYYCGMKDGDYYYFDEMKDEYFKVEGDAGKALWATNAEYLTFPATTSAEILPALAGLIASEEEGVTYYSSGEGNLYVEYKAEEEGATAEVIYQFKDNLVTKEYVKATDGNGNEMTSNANLKYRASVKLPSTKNYTEKTAF